MTRQITTPISFRQTYIFRMNRHKWPKWPSYSSLAVCLNTHLFLTCLLELRENCTEIKTAIDHWWLWRHTLNAKHKTQVGWVGTRCILDTQFLKFWTRTSMCLYLVCTISPKQTKYQSQAIKSLYYARVQQPLKTKVWRYFRCNMGRKWVRRVLRSCYSVVRHESDCWCLFSSTTQLTHSHN